MSLPDFHLNIHFATISFKLERERERERERECVQNKTSRHYQTPSTNIYTQMCTKPMLTGTAYKGL